MTTAETPFLIQALRMYRTWKTRAMVYAVVFLLAVGTALILDLRFGFPPASVLCYVLALTAVLMIGVPAAVVGAQRLPQLSISKYLKFKIWAFLAVSDPVFAKASLRPSIVDDYVLSLQEELQQLKEHLAAVTQREQAWIQVQKMKNHLEEMRVANERAQQEFQESEAEIRQTSEWALMPDGTINYRQSVYAHILELQRRFAEAKLPNDANAVVESLLQGLWGAHSVKVLTMKDPVFPERQRIIRYSGRPNSPEYFQGMADLTIAILEQLSKDILNDPDPSGSIDLMTGRIRRKLDDAFLLDDLGRLRRRE